MLGTTIVSCSDNRLDYVYGFRFPISDYHQSGTAGWRALQLEQQRKPPEATRPVSQYITSNLTTLECGLSNPVDVIGVGLVL